MAKNRVRFELLGIALLLQLGLAAALLAQSGGPAALDASEEAKISKMLADSGVPSVSIAIVEHGQLACAKAFGKASLDPSRVADAQTRYAVGSISKQFTAAAILLLAAGTTSSS